MQVTLLCTEAGLSSTQRHVSAGCIDLLSSDQPEGNTLSAVLWPSSLVCLWEKRTWIKLPKWKNTFPLVFTGSQLTSLLLLSVLKRCLKKVCRSNFAVWLWKDNLYHWFFFTRDLTVSLLLSQGQCWRQRVILWQKKSSNASQPPALHLTISGAKTSPSTASVLPCAVLRLCRTCCLQTHAGTHFHLGAACWCACDISE